MEHQIGTVVGKVLTEMQAPSTKGIPKTTIFERFKRNAGFRVDKHPDLPHMLEATATFAASINFTKPHWLTLTGRSGCGKTHLARKVFRQFMDQNRFELTYDPMANRVNGNTGQFCSWRRAAKEFVGGNFGLIDDLIEDWFVVLDDIGTAHDPRGFLASALDQIIDGRRGKWTMITCNMPLREISAKIDTRVASRLLRDGGVVIECGAPDYNA